MARVRRPRTLKTTSASWRPEGWVQTILGRKFETGFEEEEKEA